MLSHDEKILNLARVNSGRTAQQLFHLALHSLGEGITDASIDRLYQRWELTDELPPTVKSYCQDVVAWNRDVQQKL